MQPCEFSAAGLDSLVVGAPAQARAIVVILHGYAMRPEDLEPFAHSLRSPALFCFPRAPHAAQPGGYTWWPIDEDRRMQQIAVGPRDLGDITPPERPARRRQLRRFLMSLRQYSPNVPLILGGFSQGGMMACDTVLCGGQPVDALALFSSSRIATEEWSAQRHVLRNLPVLITHGRHDADLAFSAGEALRDFHVDSGARVTWQPFEGGHEMPLIVWRALRTFLKELCFEPALVHA